MSADCRKIGFPTRRRQTPIPVVPRVPTPMPPSNNNNDFKSNSEEKDLIKNHPSSVGSDIPKLITKAANKVLDNDVKTAWINPRLISKIDMEMIKKTDYVPPSERNMNGHYHSYQQRLYQRPQGCGRVHDREWETPVNVRAKHRSVPASTSVQQRKNKPATASAATKAKQLPPTMETYSRPIGRTKSKFSHYQRNTRNTSPVIGNSSQESKGIVGYHQSATACYVGGMAGSALLDTSGVYGVYSETKYIYAVNGLAACHAQSSAAAAFFARAAQKLNLSASPHRKKKYNSEDAENSGFCGVLQKAPPPVPPALLRRIGVKEVSGVGKVKVMLRVSNSSGSSGGGSGGETSSSNSFFSLDKRKKQVTLIDPTSCNGLSPAPEDRRVGVAAPKMFAFDAIFSQDDSQTEVCSSALTDVIHAVINGNDGCLFCFGHAGLGKRYTMIGSSESSNTLGIIPCAIYWLFKGINEQKQKTGARFSVRVSAVEICGSTNQLRDLLTGYASDSEQSPGVYLRDDPIFSTQPPHCELRVPTAEKAAYYLDVAVDGRKSAKEEQARDSHFLFTLHVYQYSVAGKGGVAGGRSRLHLIDLGNSDRGKANGGIPLSGVGNILLAIFNGQKHLPYKEHKLTHLLKDCLSSLTCHAAMIVHVSPSSQNYTETLMTVQLASRIHRMRRRKIKFISSAAGNGSGGSSGEEVTRTTGTSSEPDPSSSDLSADTVIYMGPADDATDCEHPPVYIPCLNSGDNRFLMSKALRGSNAEQRQSQVLKLQKSEDKQTHRPSSKANQSNRTSPAQTNSPKSSPSRILSTKNKSDSCKPINGSSDEQWIDGPRISKSKVAEARHILKEACHVKKRETWIDGPMQTENVTGYGYMDSHKKSMIRKWVEHQTIQIQKSKYHHPRAIESKQAKEAPKELTQFKCSEDDIVKPINTEKQELVEESIIRTGLKMVNVTNDIIPECYAQEENEKKQEQVEDLEDDDEPEIPPALPLIQPLSSREVSLESLDMLLKERMLSNAEYNSFQNFCHDDNEESGDEVLEIIEVEEPLEPVPTQDCCLQVTEEDIALCMGYTENPLPEVDQENPFDHPLRILSQENLTVVSTFTDSMSVFTDLERILPRQYYERGGLYNDDYEELDHPYVKNSNLDDTTKKKFDQLARLHKLYSNRLAKANVANSETYQKQKHNNRVLTRCESLSLSDMLYGDDRGENDDNSIYSEPVYVQEKFCEKCKVNRVGTATAQNWYSEMHFSASTHNVKEKKRYESALSSRFQRYCHKYKDNNLTYLRHPDGASNPNLREETNKRISGSGVSCSEKNSEKISDDSITSQPLPPPNSLPSVERTNRAILNLETGVTAIKSGHKSEGYDSGHDSTPRTLKHSPAVISRRAESGYDSVVRDSENSSIDSEPSRLKHFHNRRGRCKHKHEKSFCSWFLNPFTCKYIDEPPETHF